MSRGFIRLWNRPQVAPVGLSCSHYGRTATDWTELQTLVTEKQPQLTFSSCQTNTWRNNLMYTVDHTFSYCSQKFIRGCSQYQNQRQKFKTSGNNRGTRKVLDGLPLTHKVAYGCQTVVQGQGYHG